MRLIKDQFVRFFAVGFAAGAMLVVASMGAGAGGLRLPTLVPAAHAAAVHSAAANSTAVNSTGAQ